MSVLVKRHGEQAAHPFDQMTRICPENWDNMIESRSLSHLVYSTTDSDMVSDAQSGLMPARAGLIRPE